MKEDLTNNILVRKRYMSEGHLIEFFKVVKQTKHYITLQPLSKKYFSLLDEACAFSGVDVIDKPEGNTFRKSISTIKSYELYNPKINYWTDMGTFYSPKESKALELWKKRRKFIPTIEDKRDILLTQLLKPSLIDKIKSFFSKKTKDIF
jgi:hypothetical protein